MTRWHSMTREQKDTENARKKKWRNENLEIVRKKKRAYYESKLDFYKAYERNRQYQKMYGISVEDYDRMLLSQSGKCKVCGSSKPGGTRRFFCIDHCHSTGRVRGLLCTGCNVGVGFFEKLHKQITKYLEDA